MTETTLDIFFAQNAGTTGYHLLRAAQKAGLTTRASSGETASAWRLWVESFGQELLLPSPHHVLEGNVAAWMIDSHVNVKWQRRIAPAFAHIFCAQRAAVAALHSASVPCSWLPLAAPENLVDKGPLLRDRRFDLAFVGSAPAGSPRARVLDALRTEFSFVPTPKSFVPPAEMMEAYRQAKIVVNLPIGGDLNMRVFEAAAAGSLLATSACDGLGAIFPTGGPELVPDQDPGTWVRHIHGALRAENGQQRADALHDAVRAGHTYGHRLQEIRRILTRTPPTPVAETDRLRALVSGFVHYGQASNVWKTPRLGPSFRATSTAAATGVAAARIVFGRGSRVFPGLANAVQRARSSA